MVEKAIQELKKGISINRYSIQATLLPKARFIEEINAELWLRQNGSPIHLMFVKLFKGRPPYYKPWIELFDIIPSLKIDNQTIEYIDSPVEDTILQFFTGALNPGENIFVEYYRDRETRNQLQKGIPIPATRLGYKLFDLGYTWFKDWYFPEGFMEGEQKLQAEKPLDERSRKRQNGILKDELASFLGTGITKGPTPVYMSRAIERISSLSKHLEQS